MTATGRPAMLQRFPDGAGGKSFFQKRVPAGAPDWLRDHRGDHAERHHLQRPGGRRHRPCPLGGQPRLPRPAPVAVPGRRPDHADELRIDLDPQPGTSFDEVRAAAATCRPCSTSSGIVGYPKTTGNRGLHVYVRLEPRWDSFEVRAGAVALARELERRHPDLITANWWKEERGERVFVDFNQNAPHKTVFGAWFARPRVGRPGLDPAVLGRGRHGRSRGADHPYRPRPASGGGATPGRRSPTSRSPSSRCWTWPARDRAAGLHDAPWPPEYPKQPDEPTRVAPEPGQEGLSAWTRSTALRRIAYLLERDGAETYKVRAFRNAAAGHRRAAGRRAGRDDLGRPPEDPRRRQDQCPGDRRGRSAGDDARLSRAKLESADRPEP